MTDALVEPLTTSPMRALLGHRFSSRVDRALVFLSPEGEHRVAHPHGAGACHHRPPGLAMVRRKAFDHVLWVSLLEYDTPVHLPDRTTDGRIQPLASRTAAWRVTDPVAAARNRLRPQDVSSWIAHDLIQHGRLAVNPEYTREPALGGTVRPDSVWGPEHEVLEMGIAYRIRSVVVPPAADSSTAPVMPAAWGEEQHSAYRFYREAVAQGPHSLAALWLLRHPNQAPEVLDWTIRNQSLLNDRTSWESSLVALLQGLSDHDRAFIGVKVAEVLGDLGVPHAAEVLDRVQGAQPSPLHGYPEGFR
ncbi:hypothetical protein ACFP51_03435 [Streptomyces pratens]|uniref:HEAT repeat domain-containing protein n=1 Tax=Streptomyces pratens TaxID=887456 RepID=A0ABW1M9H8_9ACTN